MRKWNLELIVGVFVLAAILGFVYLTVKAGGMEGLGGGEYELHAVFANCGGLRPNANVVIAGVRVGRVKRITLEDYQADVLLTVTGGTEIQEDAIATVKTRGLLGETYLEIAPGGSDVILKPGGKIRDTEPALDLYALVAKYVFSQQSGGDIE